MKKQQPIKVGDIIKPTETIRADLSGGGVPFIAIGNDGKVKQIIGGKFYINK